MPIINTPRYLPRFPLRNGHIHTMYPALFRRVEGIRYRRERIETPDGDFIDIDWALADKAGESRSRAVVIILHGLDGSSNASYARGIAKACNKHRWDAVAMNFRGCSGKPNRLYRAYHAGETADLALVVDHVRQRGYGRIALAGFSIGGNMALKYLGESGANAAPGLVCAAAVSAPCDLRSSAMKLAEPIQRIYLNRFLRTLKAKLADKTRVFSTGPSQQEIASIRHLGEFDDLYTAPANGFKNAVEYWALNSSRQFIPSISIPTLLLSAADDPFLGKECFPFEEASRHRCFYFAAPRYGGHVGFYGPGEYFSESRITAFFEEQGL